MQGNAGPAAQFAQFIESLPDGIVISTPAGTIVACNAHMCELSGYPSDEIVGMPVDALVPGRMRAEHVALRAAYMSQGGETRAMSERLDIVLLRADRTELPVDISLSTFTDGEDHLVVAAVRDASARRIAEREIEQERAYVSAMHSISAALLGGDDANVTLRTISRYACELFEADLAVVAVPAGEHIEFLVCYGYGAESLEGSTVPNDGSLSGAVMREHEPVLLVDAGTDERLHRPEAWPEDIGPAFFVPLMAGETPLGNLVVARRSGQALFPVNQVLAMKAFAAQVALALADARAQEALRSLRVLEDRDRVAAAMSDTVVNRLSGASLTLHALLGDDLPEAAKKRIWDVIDELDGAIAAVRTAVFPR